MAKRKKRYGEGKHLRQTPRKDPNLQPPAPTLPPIYRQDTEEQKAALLDTVLTTLSFTPCGAFEVVLQQDGLGAVRTSMHTLCDLCKLPTHLTPPGNCPLRLDRREAGKVAFIRQAPANLHRPL